jgi:hypothetical protein
MNAPANPSQAHLDGDVKLRATGYKRLTPKTPAC